MIGSDPFTEVVCLFAFVCCFVCSFIFLLLVFDECLSVCILFLFFILDDFHFDCVFVSITHIFYCSFTCLCPYICIACLLVFCLICVCFHSITLVWPYYRIEVLTYFFNLNCEVRLEMRERSLILCIIFTISTSNIFIVVSTPSHFHPHTTPNIIHIFSAGKISYSVHHTIFTSNIFPYPLHFSSSTPNIIHIFSACKSQYDNLENLTSIHSLHVYKSNK